MFIATLAKHTVLIYVGFLKFHIALSLRRCK